MSNVIHSEDIEKDTDIMEQHQEKRKRNTKVTTKNQTTMQNKSEKSRKSAKKRSSRIDDDQLIEPDTKRQRYEADVKNDDDENDEVTDAQNSKKQVDGKIIVEEDKPKLPRCKCPICDKEVTKKQLQRHIDEMHSELPKFQCNLCPFVTKRNHQLQMHKLALHFEPMETGRPRKRSKGERRSRSPFRIKEFKRRHEKSMKMLDKVDKLDEWKEQFIAKLDSKDKEIEKLTESNSKLTQDNIVKDVELEKLKIRVAILEQKTKKSSLPSLSDISGLLSYLNLDTNSSLKQIRDAVKLRVYETSPESPVETNVTESMNKEERENLTIYLNQMQCTLIEWKKNQLQLD